MIKLFDKLDEVIIRYEEVSNLIADPDTINNQAEWRKLMKEHSDMSLVVAKYKEYKNALAGFKEAEEMLNEKIDDEFKELVKEDFVNNKELMAKTEEELKILLLPRDINDDKNVIVEIRAGAGGDEASIFAGDLFRLYSRYAERHGWNIELMNMNDSGAAGCKEVIFTIRGNGAYSRLKYESGVHRVQRVPATESAGRIHTSTATVAVLAEVEDVEVEIGPNDVRIDVFRAGGNGGQCVNTTDSAVRITHIPTGLAVSCQDEKSQLKNKDKAMKVLRARLYNLEQEKQNSKVAAERKSQVGTGDRSEKIRTYNYPQTRITDHRLPITIYKLDYAMDGDIDDLIDAIITFYQAEKLKNLG